MLSDTSQSTNQGRATITTLTPVGDLIRDAWSVTKDKWKSFLKIMAVVAGIEILLAIALGGVLTGLGVTGMLQSGSVAGVFGNPLFIVAIIAWAIPALLFATAGSIATYRVAYESLESFSVLELLKSSFKLVVPLLILGFLTSLLVLGGFMLFVIPGIIFSILFVFAPYEVIFQAQSPINALKRSAAIVTQNFGAIFKRWLAFVGVMLVFGIITGIIENIFGPDSAVNGILQLIGNFIVATFSTIYFILLYKQVRVATDAAKPFNLIWVIVASVLGWVVGLFIIGSLVTAMAAYITESTQSGSELDSFDPSLYLQDLESMEQEYVIDDSVLMMDEVN